MKKLIIAGCVMATLLAGGYACTNDTTLSPDSAAARSGSVQSGTATGPHSGTATRPQMARPQVRIMARQRHPTEAPVLLRHLNTVDNPTPKIPAYRHRQGFFGVEASADVAFG